MEERSVSFKDYSNFIDEFKDMNFIQFESMKHSQIYPSPMMTPQYEPQESVLLIEGIDHMEPGESMRRVSSSQYSERNHAIESCDPCDRGEIFDVIGRAENKEAQESIEKIEIFAAKEPCTLISSKERKSAIGKKHFFDLENKDDQIDLGGRGSDDEDKGSEVKKRESFEERVHSMAKQKKVYSREKRIKAMKSMISEPSIKPLVTDVQRVLSKIFSRQSSELEFESLNSELDASIREILKPNFELGPFLEIVRVKKRRRSEEENKFIVKKGLKFLIRKFKRDNSKVSHNLKVLDELEFYRFYFQSEVDLEAFLMPGCKLQRASSKNNLNRTVSEAYLERIFSSSAFRKDFRDYVVNHFEVEYNLIKESKIEAIAKCVCEGNGKKVQIPWTDAEVQKAKVNFLKLLEKF